jgi:hypothetical protein
VQFYLAFGLPEPEKIEAGDQHNKKAGIKSVPEIHQDRG